MLEFKLEDWWGPLCEFLGKPRLDADIPFPRVNDAAAIKELIALSMRFGIFAWLRRVSWRFEIIDGIGGRRLQVAKRQACPPASKFTVMVGASIICHALGCTISSYWLLHLTWAAERTAKHNHDLRPPQSRIQMPPQHRCEADQMILVFSETLACVSEDSTNACSVKA